MTHEMISFKVLEFKDNHGFLPPYATQKEYSDS